MSKDRNRWPTSIHSQCEAVFHSIRSIRSKKIDNPLCIRSFGAWRVYLYETHRFVEFMRLKGRGNILNIQEVRADRTDYLTKQLDEYSKKKRSRQTMETILSALGKFEFAINRYIEMHLPPSQPKLDTEQIRKDFYISSKKLLPKSSRKFDNRAYEDPIALIEALSNRTYQLQACLMYEGGLRTEGVGAPSNQLKNPLNQNSLRGIIPDPVSGAPVGIVSSREKGGKETEHYISVETYYRLKKYIEQHGKLESNYFAYISALTKAAKETNQHFPGRGSHGLKHGFAQERYQQCVAHGMTHEQALQQTSLETSHFRMTETLGYTRGR